MAELLDETIEPLDKRQGFIWVYKFPEDGFVYYAGLDAAEGKGGDYTVLWIEGKRRGSGTDKQLVCVARSKRDSSR